MFDPLLRYLYSDPITIWYIIGGAIVFYLFIYPRLLVLLDGYRSRQQQRDHSDDIRAARLRQSDAMRLAIKMTHDVDHHVKKDHVKDVKKDVHPSDKSSLSWGWSQGGGGGGGKRFGRQQPRGGS